MRSGAAYSQGAAKRSLAVFHGILLRVSALPLHLLQTGPPLPFPPTHTHTTTQAIPSLGLPCLPAHPRDRYTSTPDTLESLSPLQQARFGRKVAERQTGTQRNRRVLVPTRASSTDYRPGCWIRPLSVCLSFEGDACPLPFLASGI